MADALFWEIKKLSQMSHDEWESLCDGCGKCCMHKLEDEDTGELLFTNVACAQLDLSACRCKVYPKRWDYVPDCLTLTPQATQDLSWLPSTCAYRLLAAGQALPVWHPLISGNPDTVHSAQVSVRHKAISECSVDAEDWDMYVIDNL